MRGSRQICAFEDASSFQMELEQSIKHFFRCDTITTGTTDKPVLISETVGLQVARAENAKEC